MTSRELVIFGSRKILLRYLSCQLSICHRRWQSGWGSQTTNFNDIHDRRRTRQESNKKDGKNHAQTRAEMIDVNQTEWSSVYETASPYNTHVIPLEIRMGRPRQMKPTGRLKDVPLDAKGNIELLKIPNFFHLTPPAIDKHCNVLKEYCTPWPKYVATTRHPPVRVTTINYLFSGPSIRHPESKKVKLQVYLKDLKLDKHAKRKFKLLVGDRYNPGNDEVTLITDKCPTRKQNKEYAYYLLTALCVESRKTEQWEKEAKSKTEEEIDDEVEQIRTELYPKYYEDKKRTKRHYRVINEKLIRYNSYGHPFVCEMRKHGIKGGLDEEEMRLAKREWENIQKGLPDNTSFDPPYNNSFASQYALH